MSRLIYSAICSLDGFTADRDGDFAWSAPDEQVHAFVNEQERSVGTMLLGRRMYQVLSVWDDLPGLTEEPEPIREYARIWAETEKVVYSSTLDRVATRRTRLEPTFHVESVRGLIDAADRDVSIGGARLAAQALRAGLVDELQLYLNPIVIGAGTAALPADTRLELELQEQRRFDNGVVFLRYRVR